MFNDLKRNFRRAAKTRNGEPLTIDDITTIRPMDQPGTTYSFRAKRQHNSEYWKIYGSGNPVLPRDWSPMTLYPGLTLTQTLDQLEKMENEYAAELRGKKSPLPYNHYKKVREMLEAEEAAAQPVAAAPAAVPATETQEAVTVRSPLILKKPST